VSEHRAGSDHWHLDVAGQRVEPTAVLVGAEVDTARAEVDVTVHHPALAGLDAPQRAEVAGRLLRLALGEEAVRAWVGTVTASEQRPRLPVTLERLREVVAALAVAEGGDVA
jgi:hypothetical protein